MTLGEFLNKWKLDLKIKIPIINAEFTFQDTDKNAAWELYIELLTRIAIQPLATDTGDEETALKSMYELFGITREIIKKNGYNCIQFTKIALVVLNQVIRPFTAKWHKLSIEGAFRDKAKCKEFRKELEKIQEKLRSYTGLLSDIIGIEDLTDMQIE